MSLLIGKERTPEGDILGILCIDGVITHRIAFKESQWNSFSYAMPKGVVVPANQLGTRRDVSPGMTFQGRDTPQYGESPAGPPPGLSPEESPAPPDAIETQQVGSGAAPDPMTEYLKKRKEDEGAAGQ